MSDPMTVDSFEHVINALNAYLFSYMAPKDLFRLSCANKVCKKDVDEHFFEACRLQLETPVEPLGLAPVLELSGDQCSVIFGRGRSFDSKTELVNFVSAKWNIDDTLLENLRVSRNRPDLTWGDALMILTTSYSPDFFDDDKPYMSVWDGDNELLRTDLDFNPGLRNDSSGLSCGGKPSPLWFLLNSNEKQFIKDWVNYFMASKMVVVECWSWDIRQQYSLAQSTQRCHFGFSCVFSMRAGSEELELFADVESSMIFA
jgi:hypothetical protein